MFKKSDSLLFAKIVCTLFIITWTLSFSFFHHMLTLQVFLKTSSIAALSTSLLGTFFIFLLLKKNLLSANNTLPNRSRLEKKLSEMILENKKTNKGIAILCLRIANINSINVIYGHKIGDILLKKSAERLKKILSSESVMTKIREDTFCIIKKNLENVEKAHERVKFIIHCFSENFNVDNVSIHTTINVGITFFPQDADNPPDLIRHADIAMHAAGKIGHDNYQFYNKKMNVLIEKQMILFGELRHAIKRNEFILYYQPQIKIATQALVGAEALIRWCHPEFGIVSPADFLPLAEESSFIHEMGYWLIKSVCEQIKRWENSHLKNLRIAINLSLAQFNTKNNQPTIYEMIENIVKETKVNKNNLEFEITESVMTDDPAQVIHMTQQIKKLGIQISLDDFGTGYSSLSYFSLLPIDKLKIDASFIRNLFKKPENALILASLIQLGHDLNLKVLAEGVETKEAFKFLKEKKCDEAQGYLFSRPLPLIAFEDFAKTYPSDGS